MERSLFDMTLELQAGYSNASVTVKRGDTHRTLRIRLSDGGRPYSIQPQTQAVFTAVKPDGNHLYNICKVENDTVFYDLTPQTTNLAGELECELRLYDLKGGLLTSAAFRLWVEDTVYADGDETVASSGEATALTRLLEETEEKLEQMDQVLKDEVNRAIIDDSAIGKDAWSSKKIADMFCPAFQTQGAHPTCQPLEGYPLEAVSTIAPKAGGDLWEQMEARELGKLIDRFLDAQTSRNRIVFVRRYWYGDSVKHIARSLGLKESTVSVRLSRTRASLKDYLEKEGYHL